MNDITFLTKMPDSDMKNRLFSSKTAVVDAVKNCLHRPCYFGSIRSLVALASAVLLAVMPATAQAQTSATDHFVLKITTTITSERFTFHTEDTNYDIDWDDDQTFESADIGVSGNQEHTFALPGEHILRFRNLNDIHIKGRLPTARRYTSIEQWGTSLWNADMSRAFEKASNLTMNPVAGTPNMSMVTNMSGMFEGARAFNGDIGGWNTAKVTNMSNMFKGAISFNGDIGRWDTEQVTDMSYMFQGARAFNGDIGEWTTAAVTNMSGMFAGAHAFNQDIGGWTTAAVTTMLNMFASARSFDQNIGRWDVRAVTTMQYMFSGATVATVVALSPANYDALLVGWNGQDLQKGVVFHGGDSTKYSSDAAHTARANMTNTVANGGDNWTITDGGRGQPGDIATKVFLSSTSIAENGVPNAVVGTLSTNGGAATGYLYNTATGSPPNDISDLNSFTIEGNTLKLNAPADYETKATYRIKVHVRDSARKLLFFKTFTISVEDVNEAPTASDAPFSVAENSTNGTEVGTVTATDPDQTSPNKVLTYAITSGNAGSVFDINSRTGVVTVAGVLDYETTPSYSLEVTVTDGGSPSLRGTATITIMVTDVNDAPIARDATFSPAENSATGTAVGTVTATDQDQTSPNNALTYAITGGDTGNVFAIHSTTGDITVAGALDFETTPSYSLEVTVTDGGSPSLSGTATITITVEDVNEAPTVPVTSTPFSVAENSTTGTEVGSVAGTDPDQTSPNNALTYAITGGNTGTVFAIHSTTGEITVAGALDYETTASYSLVVTVTDGGSTPLSSTAMITITVTDENDAPTATDATFSPAENSANGTVVGSVAGADPDQTSPNNALTYAITGGDTGSVFAINETTGEITVAGVLDYENHSILFARSDRYRRRKPLPPK